MEKPNINIMDIFESEKLVKICAPMVRYSKLQFRNLVKLYDCNIMFTPMILADSFCKSIKARNNEFTTNLFDSPLITQFAANTAFDFVGAAYMAAPYCNGADLNCGCPQRWARDMELGCSMLSKPEIIYDIVRQCRNQIPKPFTISVKMRLLNDISDNIKICQQLEKCGISFITLHGRTFHQSNGEINKNALKEIKRSLRIPLIGNGGVTSLQECYELQEEIGCEGIMVANGILNNPSLFRGSTITPLDCIQTWVNLCYNSTFSKESYYLEALNPKFTIHEKPPNLTFQCFHHHLVFMMDKQITKKEKRYFNNLKKFSEVLNFLKDSFNITPKLFAPEKFGQFVTSELDYCGRNVVYDELKPEKIEMEPKFILYDPDKSDGKHFENKINTTDSDWANIFLEND